MDGEVDELEEGVMDVEEGKLQEELVDKPRTTIGTKFSVLHCIRIPFFLWNVVFDHWSLRRNIRFHRKAFQTTVLLVCFRELSLSRISTSLTSTVASLCVCTSPLAVMTIVGLHEFVKVSISASLKSFLLIMCVVALESTTNSLSSGLRFDGAGRHQFARGMMFYVFPLILWYFGQLQRCFAGTSLLPVRLFLTPILKFWSVGATIAEEIITVTNRK